MGSNDIIRSSTSYNENNAGKSIYGSTVRESVAGRKTTAKSFVGLMRKSKKDRLSTIGAHQSDISQDDEFWNPDAKTRVTNFNEQKYNAIAKMDPVAI